eukprot:Nk52_evm70s1444 gene=Nk52_evmTU70s1444
MPTVLGEGSASSSEKSNLVKRLCAKAYEAKNPGQLRDVALSDKHNTSVLKLTQYVSRILDSKIGEPTIIDEFATLERMKKRLMKDNKTTEAVRLSACSRSLQQSHVFSKLDSIFAFLSIVSENEQLAKHEVKSLFGDRTALIDLEKKRQEDRLGHLLAKALSLGERSELCARDKQEERTIEDRAQQLISERMTANLKPRVSDMEEITEFELVRDVLFAFQGIDGKYLKFHPQENQFLVDPKFRIRAPVMETLMKLSEVGWYYKRVRESIASSSKKPSSGFMQQALSSALQDELTEHYKFIAVLENSLKVKGEKCGLTLKRLLVWIFEPSVTIKTLAQVATICVDKEGGQLATVLYQLSQHGDDNVKNLITRILSKVLKPFYSLLQKWMFEGELNDPFNEFFIACDNTVEADNLWFSKYCIESVMRPVFVDKQLGNRILLIGKSINFIHHVCKDRKWVMNRTHSVDMIEIMEKTSFDDLSALRLEVDSAYTETSEHLLFLLKSQFKMKTHLEALRKYLLLGQGDFIQQLMDLLHPELDKEASGLYLHNLSSALESAIRATNAQYDDPDVLKRLDVRLLEMSQGDFGWDVFSLDYHMNPPLNTLFSSEPMHYYLRIFNFLWRIKRIDFNLKSSWRMQMNNTRAFKHLDCMGGILHKCHMLQTEMLHFISQVQYYFVFEVLECSWTELLCDMEKAQDLDQLIESHSKFLTQVTERSLLSEKSQDMLNQLRTIFDLINQFFEIHSKLFAAGAEENDLRANFAKRAYANTLGGQWGTTGEEETVENRRRAYFDSSIIPGMQNQLCVVSSSFQDMACRFLASVSMCSDINLKFLCFRLDFNEHYSNLNPIYLKVGQKSFTSWS